MSVPLWVFVGIVAVGVPLVLWWLNRPPTAEESRKFYEDLRDGKWDK